MATDAPPQNTVRTIPPSARNADPLIADARALVNEARQRITLQERNGVGHIALTALHPGQARTVPLIGV